MSDIQILIPIEGDMYSFHLECIFYDAMLHSNSVASFVEEKDALRLLVVRSDGKGGQKEVCSFAMNNNFSKKPLIETFFIESAKTASF